ncbi:unnamed protein product [Symbiodinium natans]|uniref:Uncharacterized protein n=1 Tax=Symbiodinium natans TaxID=878477 RepID=A0A812UAP1_9DINO|nr:unnamed protein product [Symbiodinium natans]
MVNAEASHLWNIFAVTLQHHIQNNPTAQSNRDMTLVFKTFLECRCGGKPPPNHPKRQSKHTRTQASGLTSRIRVALAKHRAAAQGRSKDPGFEQDESKGGSREAEGLRKSQDVETLLLRKTWSIMELFRTEARRACRMEMPATCAEIRPGKHMRTRLTRGLAGVS